MGISVADIVGGGLLDAVSSIISKFKEDPTKAAEFRAAIEASTAEFRLKAMEIEADVQKRIDEQVRAQIAVNEADAKGNLFQSSWRPLIGYICGSGLLYQLFLRPMINFGSQMLGINAVAEQLDMGTLLSLLFGMLGLGAMRMTEKLQGKA